MNVDLEKCNPWSDYESDNPSKWRHFAGLWVKFCNRNFYYISCVRYNPSKWRHFAGLQDWLILAYFFQQTWKGVDACHNIDLLNSTIDNNWSIFTLFCNWWVFRQLQHMVNVIFKLLLICVNSFFPGQQEDHRPHQESNPSFCFIHISEVAIYLLAELELV